MYSFSIDGPNKKQMINEFLISRLLENINLMSQNIEEENLKKIHEMEKELINKESNLSQLKSNIQLAKQDFKNKMK